jgi:hypothetical protein
MLGPRIIANSISLNAREDTYGNVWQYNPWSDHHSKVACWAVLFDLMRSCELLREHARKRKIGFGINHTMSDFRLDRPKDLDLVVCTPREEPGGGRSFVELGKAYGVSLTAAEKAELRSLPALYEAPVGVVHLALEAKATMTEHVKALPRLYDELTSSHLAIHGTSNMAIAVGLSIINASEDFISPKRNPWKIVKRRLRLTAHLQPKAVLRTIEKVKQVPRRTNVDERGFDAFGIVVIACRNDASTVELVTKSPAPAPADILHYDAMIRRAAQLYEARFPRA